MQERLKNSEPLFSSWKKQRIGWRKKGRNKMKISISLVFALQFQAKTKAGRLGSMRGSLSSTFVGEPQTSEVSCRKVSVTHHEDSRRWRTAKRKSGVSISFVRVKKSRDSLERESLKNCLRSTREILNLKTCRQRKRLLEIVFRNCLKLEKMMLKSSEGCQRCVVGDRLVALAAAGQETAGRQDRPGLPLTRC